jgi:hypothetical protein
LPEKRNASEPSAFPLGSNREPLFLAVKTHNQDVGLAADLAIFHVLLPGAGGLVDLGNIPLAAVAALKTGRHAQIVT